MKVQLDSGAFMPQKAHDTDAGYDLFSPINVVLPPRGSDTINTGVHIELPPNTVGMIKSKSGLNVKGSILSEGVIDVGYTGSIAVKLYNHGEEYYLFNKGDKISQLVILPLVDVGELEQVEKINGGDRGNNGFGSTGK